MNTAPVENWFYQMQKAMDVLDVQHRIISSNIANVNTPAFHKLQLDFKEEMSRLLTASEDANQVTLRAVPNGLAEGASAPNGITPTVDTDSPARADGNNVNLEREMVDLAQTNEVYSTLSQVAIKNLRIMRYVISGGRG
jgi:flagellar basal-body rod protein FlgB